MPYSLVDRVKNAWNAFTSRDPTRDFSISYGNSYIPPSHQHTYYNGDQSIVNMIENRIAVDVAQIDVRHVKVDENGNYQETIDSGLNRALSISANIDQSGRAFIQDVVMSMFDEGTVAIVPIDTDVDPKYTEGYDILTLRTGRILDYYSDHVRLETFNDRACRKETIVLPKKTVAIVENPFYAIMNEPNSTLKRLVRTLHNLDYLNESNVNGKMNLIIQLPYSLRNPLKQKEADDRLEQVERQMNNSKYGIAYIDASERITQLNRPAENNLWEEAQDLTHMLFNQLGLNESIFNGTADDKTLNNYYNRTIEPILVAITEEMQRKFISKTARTKHHAIIYMRDPFKLATVNDISSTASDLISSQIMTSNEIRAKIGLPPSDSPQADELINPNINKINDLNQTNTNSQPEINQNEEETA